MYKNSLVTQDPTLSNYLSYIYKIKLLTEEEEKKLAIEWHENQNKDAAQTLVTSHLPLVLKVALVYKNYGQPLGDLISEGSIGLMRAVSKFDPYAGVRLSTYAMWWIKAYISEYILNTWSLVKNGSLLGRKKLFFSLKRIKANLGIEGKDIPLEKVKQIAKEVSVSENNVISVNNMIEYRDSSLNAVAVENNSGGEEIYYEDLLADKVENTPEVIYEVKEENLNNKKIFKEVFELFNEREKYIITNRFLLEKAKSLQEIATQLNLSRERVRQIEQSALNKAKTFIENKND